MGYSGIGKLFQGFLKIHFQVSLNSSSFPHQPEVRIKAEPDYSYFEDDYYEDGNEDDFWEMPAKKKKRASRKEKKPRKRKRVDPASDVDDNEDDYEDEADENDEPKDKKRYK